MRIEQVMQAFSLAGYNVSGVEKIENDYWPKHPDYDKVRNDNPWYLVTTAEVGTVRLGWRKRVVEIDWSRTERRGLIPGSEDATRDLHMVHAWDLGEVVSYLKRIRELPVVKEGDIRTFTWKDRKKALSNIRAMVKDISEDLTPTKAAVLDWISGLPKDVPVTITLTAPKEGYKTSKFMVHITAGDVSIRF